MAGLLTKDSDWIRRSFLVAAKDLVGTDARDRVESSAMWKFTDTTPGGNLAINAPTQFTHTADIRPKSPVAGITARQGRYYSEAIDDNAQRIYMRFGQASYNSMTSFFTGFADASLTQLAKRGKGTSLFFKIGIAAGLVGQIAAFPPLLVLYVGKTILDMFLGRQVSKYYYLAPRMALYWGAVQDICNRLGVARGMVMRPDTNVGEFMQTPGQPTPPVSLTPKRAGHGITLEQYEQVAQIHPDIMHQVSKGDVTASVFPNYGGIDVYRIATKAQRRHMRMLSRLAEFTKNSSSSDIKGKLGQAIQMKMDTGQSYFESLMGRWKGNTQNTEELASSPDMTWGQAVDIPSAPPEPPPPATDGSAATAPPAESKESITDRVTAWATKWAASEGGFWEDMKANLQDGGEFVCFHVDHTGSTNESWSNSTGESEIASTINSMSSKGRSFNFASMDGNLMGGAVGSALNGVISAGREFISGVASSLELTGLMAVAGGAFVDIPEVWTGSNVSLPKSSYSFTLISPYNNPMSHMFKLYLPMAMLLAAAVPLSTGKRSYVSPFLCELYDKGRNTVRTGIIDSLSFTRGSSTLGFDKEGHALAVEVSFSVKDMSTIMHMPLASGFSFNPLSGWVNDDDAYTDYLNTVAALGLHEQIYPLQKLKLAAMLKRKQFGSYFSMSHLTTSLGDFAPVRLFSGIYKGIALP